MTTDRLATGPVPMEPPTPHRHRIAGLLLLAATATLLVCALVVGERPTDLASLQGRIAAGDVTEVRVSDSLPSGARGSTLVTIRWEEHGIARVTSVMQASSDRVARRLRRTDFGPNQAWSGPGRQLGSRLSQAPGGTPVVVGDVTDALTVGGRTVDVVGSTSPYYRGSVSTSAYGLDVPGWITGAGLLVACATLVLIGASETWRATRWAWAWIVLATPVGLVAFLVLGGPLGWFRPRPGSYRLTGGWAFLLAGAAGTATQTLLGY